MAIQWRKLALVALGRAAKTDNLAEKSVLLDIASRYRDLAEKTEGTSARRKESERN